MKKTLFLSLLLFSGLIFLSIKTNYLNKFYSIIATPFLYLSYQSARPFHAIKQQYLLLTNLQQENNQLKKQIEQLQQQSVALFASYNYLDRRKDIDQFINRYNIFDVQVCKILLKNLTPQEQYYYINRGSLDSIKENMIVTCKFQLLGKVVAVFPWYSKVQLITDPRSKIAAYTKHHKFQGIVSAYDNKLCIMEYVDIHAQIRPDDLVISSGQGMIFPEGFSIGSVLKVEQEEAYQNILIKPLIDLSKLEFCTVISQEKIPVF